MKNTFNFNLGEINVTIEGTPVQINNFQMEFTNEASVQELATSASFIKDLIGEIKSTIKEAQTSAQGYQPSSTHATTTVKTTAENKVVETPKAEQRWDLPAIWSVMTSTLPAGFDKAGVGSYVYIYECENDNGKKVKTTIKIAFNDSIDMRIYVGETKASFYLYEDAERSWADGINPSLINELIDELPDGVREFVRNFVKKVLNK